MCAAYVVSQLKHVYASPIMKKDVISVAEMRIELGLW
jgi:hypothetical protein